MAVLIAVLGLAGHVIFWAAAVNRLHGLKLNRTVMDLLTLFFGAALGGVGLAAVGVLWWILFSDFPPPGPTIRVILWCYLALMAVYGLFAAAHRLWLARHPERTGALMANHTTELDVRRLQPGPLTGPGLPTWLSYFPGNQVLHLQLHEQQLHIPRLPAELDGTRLVHLSDLHMSGRVAKPFYVEIARQVNQLAPDLIAVTGDLVERDGCLGWIPDTLGALRATDGVYYVLGNHDVRVDQQRLRAALSETDMVYLGGTWRQVTVRGAPVVLAGNELPWYSPVADLSDCPPRDADGSPPRILLAHGPDQFRWAQANDVDLMLAGHNHGGQVRLPLVGPILAPSLSGTRYACGAFRAGPTVLHVSRGTSSLSPIRWNCPPEIALLVLRSSA